MENKCLVAYLVRPAEGGIKTHLLTLLAGLDTSRVEPVVICPPGTSLYRELERAGYRTVPLDIVGELSPIRDLKAILRLRRILHEIRPDVLHIHSAKAGLVGRLAVVGTRRPRVLVSFHSFVFDERVGRLKRAVVGLIERKLLRWTDKIIAVSDALKKELVSRMRLDPGTIQVIHNGIVFRDIPKPARSGMRIGTVSRLAPQKGVDTFIRAAALVLQELPDLRVTIIGDGPLREELESLAAELGIAQSVEFLGFRADALSIVASFDVFVLSSTRETFGMTLVEALSVGVPVVASRTGGIPEIVDDPRTGLLAKPGSAEDFAAGIRKLLTDTELAGTIARCGRESVRSHFASEKMVSAVQELY